MIERQLFDSNYMNSFYNPSKNVTVAIHDLFMAIGQSEDVFVRFDDPLSRRYGSIAEFHEFSDIAMMDLVYDYAHGKPNALIREYSTHYNSGQMTTHWSLQFKFKGKPRTYVSHTQRDKLTWLQGYKGPTVFKWRKDPKPVVVRKPVYDQLGRELEVGDLVAYSCHSRVNRAKRPIIIGTISKINAPATVYCKNMKMKDGDRIEEKRITDTSQMVKLTKDLIDQLVFTKLSVE